MLFDFKTAPGGVVIDTRQSSSQSSSGQLSESTVPEASVLLQDTISAVQKMHELMKTCVCDATDPSAVTICCFAMHRAVNEVIDIGTSIIARANAMSRVYRDTGYSLQSTLWQYAPALKASRHIIEEKTGIDITNIPIPILRLRDDEDRDCCFTEDRIIKSSTRISLIATPDNTFSCGAICGYDDGLPDLSAAKMLFTKLYDIQSIAYTGQVDGLVEMLKNCKHMLKDLVTRYSSIMVHATINAYNSYKQYKAMETVGLHINTIIKALDNVKE